MSIDGCHDVLPLLQNYLAAGMPLLPWFEFDLEKEATIGIANGNITARNPVGHGAVKIVVIIGSTQPSLLHIPVSEHPATVDEP